MKIKILKLLSKLEKYYKGIYKYFNCPLKIKAHLINWENFPTNVQSTINNIIKITYFQLITDICVDNLKESIACYMDINC